MEDRTLWYLSQNFLLKMDVDVALVLQNPRYALEPRLDIAKSLNPVGVPTSWWHILLSLDGNSRLLLMDEAPQLPSKPCFRTTYTTDLGGPT